MEQLDKTAMQDRLSVEKIILEIDSKIATIMIKIKDNEKSAYLDSMKVVNDYLDKHHKKDDFPRFILKQEFDEVTADTKKKIDELINKGKKWHSCKCN